VDQHAELRHPAVPVAVSGLPGGCAILCGMPYSDVDVAHWLALDDAAAVSLAQEIARATDTSLLEVRPHSYAGRPGRVALFGRDSGVYALVPGGDTTIGYDSGRFVPSPAQAGDYADSAEEHGLPGDLHQYLDMMTTPLRTVTVPALLVAVDAREAAGGSGGSDPGSTNEWLLGRARLSREVEQLAARGMRLLTPDEWEHACGAGAPTLFHWGDHTPSDRYPTDDDQPHRTPNAFGLTIAQNPLRDERTADPDVIVGGDGGNAIRNGSGFFLSWLTLATAFRDAEYAAWANEHIDELEQILIRPAIVV
jgi:hypothetical protein